MKFFLLPITAALLCGAQRGCNNYSPAPATSATPGASASPNTSPSISPSSLPSTPALMVEPRAPVALSRTHLQPPATTPSLLKTVNDVVNGMTTVPTERMKSCLSLAFVAALGASESRSTLPGGALCEHLISSEAFDPFVTHVGRTLQVDGISSLDAGKITAYLIGFKDQLIY